MSITLQALQNELSGSAPEASQTAEFGESLGTLTGSLVHPRGAQARRRLLLRPGNHPSGDAPTVRFPRLRLSGPTLRDIVKSCVSGTGATSWVPPSRISTINAPKSSWQSSQLNHDDP